MAEAKTTLEHLSRDLRLQSLARERELAALTYWFQMATAREMGLREGEAKGRESTLRSLRAQRLDFAERRALK